MDPIPSINRVYSLTLQYERQISSSNDGFVEPVMLYAGKGNPNQHFKANFSGNFAPNSNFIGNKRTTSYNNGNGYNNGRKPTCFFCGNYGHLDDKCYKKHEFLLGYKSGNRNIKIYVNHTESYCVPSDSNMKYSAKGK